MALANSLRSFLFHLQNAAIGYHRRVEQLVRIEGGAQVFTYRKLFTSKIDFFGLGRSRFYE
jgi:hypothetical protein